MTFPTHHTDKPTDPIELHGPFDIRVDDATDCPILTFALPDSKPVVVRLSRETADVLGAALVASQARQHYLYTADGVTQLGTFSPPAGFAWGIRPELEGHLSHLDGKQPSIPNTRPKADLVQEELDLQRRNVRMYDARMEDIKRLLGVTGPKYDDLIDAINELLRVYRSPARMLGELLTRLWADDPDGGWHIHGPAEGFCVHDNREGAPDHRASTPEEALRSALASLESFAAETPKES